MEPRIVRIGLQIHVSLGTPAEGLDTGTLSTKLFCACPILGRKAPANVSTCPVCKGVAGSLPVLQRRVGRTAVRLCRALGSRVAPRIVFDRKRYFYQDLPRSYQITQVLQPIGQGGSLAGVRIQRIQIQQDPARFEGKTVDYNRCGKMLAQIVTAPTIESAAHAADVLNQLFFKLSVNGLMDESAENRFRADVNVSSIQGGRTHPRIELKNLGSQEQVRASIQAELRRQLTSEDTEVHTRTFEPAFDRTVFSRNKETASQYAPLVQCNMPPVSTAEWSPFVHTRCPRCLGGGALNTADACTKARLRGWCRVPGALDYAFFTKAKSHFIDMLLAELKYRHRTFLQVDWKRVQPLVIRGDRQALRQYLNSNLSAGSAPS